jgi:hypothetical protein
VAVQARLSTTKRKLREQQKRDRCKLPMLHDMTVTDATMNSCSAHASPISSFERVTVRKERAVMGGVGEGVDDVAVCGV